MKFVIYLGVLLRLVLPVQGFIFPDIQASITPEKDYPGQVIQISVNASCLCSGGNNAASWSYVERCLVCQ